MSARSTMIMAINASGVVEPAGVGAEPADGGVDGFGDAVCLVSRHSMADSMDSR